VLEPAVYGVPVLFGPKIENSREAKTMVNMGCGIIVQNKKEAYRRFRILFTDDESRKQLGKVSASYVLENIGATDKIIEEILSVL
jgi:3-deoxy-D-manno-octulosonic-acid transferase